MVGIGMNAGVFYRMLKVSKTLDQGTKNAQYFRRKVAFLASVILQIVMTAADIAIGGVVVGNMAGEQDLAAPGALAIIAG